MKDDLSALCRLFYCAGVVGVLKCLSFMTSLLFLSLVFCPVALAVDMSSVYLFCFPLLLFHPFVLCVFVGMNVSVFCLICHKLNIGRHVV